MIQIGTQPSLAAFAEGPPRQLGEEAAAHCDQELRRDSLSDDRTDGPLFVSPPPLPFPRVFPGL